MDPGRHDGPAARDSGDRGVKSNHLTAGHCRAENHDVTKVSRLDGDLPSCNKGAPGNRVIVLERDPTFKKGVTAMKRDLMVAFRRGRKHKGKKY